MKRKLRQTLQKKYQKVTRQQKKYHQGLIINQLKTILEKLKPTTIAGYRALQDEVDLDELYQKLLLTSQLIFPKVTPHRQLSWHQVSNLDSDFQLSQWGIREPAYNLPTVSLGQAQVALIPAQAFDLKGARLGRGGGYYDKELSKWPDLLTIGIAFAWQIIPSVPTLDYDIAMKEVVSSKKIR